MLNLINELGQFADLTKVSAKTLKKIEGYLKEIFIRFHQILYTALENKLPYEQILLLYNEYFIWYQRLMVVQNEIVIRISHN